MITSEASRVDFNTGLYIGRQPEIPTNRVPKLPQLSRQQKCWRATTEVNLLHCPPRPAEPGGVVDFFDQRFYIASRSRLILRNNGVAAAIPAEGLAERQVEIEREGPLGIALPDDLAHDFAFGQVRGEMNCRWVRRIPRPGSVVLRDLIDVYQH